MSRYLRLSLFSAIAVVSVLLVSSANPSTTQTLVPIRVGVMPVADLAPFYIGVKKGFFEQAGLEVQPTLLQSGPANIAALVGGSIDIGFTAAVPLLIAQSRGIPVKIVAGAALVGPRPDRRPAAVVVRSDSPIQTPRDLRGKTLAVTALNALDQLTIMEFLDRNGIDPNAVRYVEIPNPSMEAALDAGRVDAIYPGEPFYSAALDRGSRALFNPQVVLGNTGQVSVWITSPAYAQRRMNRLIAFAKAWQKSVAYANQHLSESRTILSEFTALNPAQAGSVRLPWWSAGLNVVSMLNQAELGQKYKLTETLADPRGLLLPATIRALAPVKKQKK